MYECEEAELYCAITCLHGDCMVRCTQIEPAPMPAYRTACCAQLSIVLAELQVDRAKVCDMVFALTKMSYAHLIGVRMSGRSIGCLLVDDMAL